MDSSVFPKRIETQKGLMEWDFIQDHEYDDCLWILAECFETEPINSSMGATKEDMFTSYLKILQPTFKSCGCSLRVRNLSENNELVAVFTVNDLEEHEKHVYSIQPKADEDNMWPELIHTLYTNYKQKEKSFHFVASGVLPKYRQGGLLNVARKMLLDLAKEKGFTTAISEASSFGSRQSLEKVGAVERGGLIYKDFVNKKGEKPFATIPPPHVGFFLMEITL